MVITYYTFGDRIETIRQTLKNKYASYKYYLVLLCWRGVGVKGSNWKKNPRTVYNITRAAEGSIYTYILTLLYHVRACIHMHT
jgi:hypothetical protein